MTFQSCLSFSHKGMGVLSRWRVPLNSLDLKGMAIETSTTSKEKGRKKMSGLSIKPTASVQLGEGHFE